MNWTAKRPNHANRKTTHSLAARYRYDAYGNTLSSSGSLAGANNYRFSSKERIPVTDIYGSELYYYGYRFYQPSLHRWLNRDPIEEEGGINLYGFCGNFPTGHIDDWGRQFMPSHGWPVEPSRERPGRSGLCWDAFYECLNTETICAAALGDEQAAAGIAVSLATDVSHTTPSGMDRMTDGRSRGPYVRQLGSTAGLGLLYGAAIGEAFLVVNCVSSLLGCLDASSLPPEVPDYRPYAPYGPFR